MSKPNCTLTNKEVEALELYLAGVSYQDIAEKLHITRTTVNSRINSIREKFGVHNFAEIRDKAIELGIIEPCNMG